MTMKALYKIGMLAVAAFAFAECSKEVNDSVDLSGTHTLTFTVQKDLDTRTAVVEGDDVASYVWNENDAQYFVIFENDKKATQVIMSDLSSDHKIATFKATFNNSTASSFTYYAVYGSSVSGSKNPLIPSEQSPALTSFDPAADALVSAEAITLENGTAADENTTFQFRLQRVVSVNKMTLKGLVAGEKISKVELESSDSYFTSRYRYDNKDYYIGNEGSKKLVLDYSTVNATVGNDGSFPVYFTCAPVVDASFSVKVITDQNLYVRDNFTSKLTLAVGTFRRFGINLSGYGTPAQTTVEYKLVEDNAIIVDGAEYLIVAKDKGKAAGAYTPSYYTPESVTVSNKFVSITSEAVQVFTLEAGGSEGQFYIKDSDGKYLYYTGSSNNVSRGEKSTTDSYLWTVTKDGITNVGTSARKLQYNNSTPRFACYTTSQTAIQLYLNEATLVQKLSTPQIELEAGDDAIYLTWNAIEGAGSYKVTCTGIDDITTTSTEATLSDLEAGFYTVTVTAIASSSSYRDSDPASVEVKVGTPDLAKPVIKTFEETNTGFNAEIQTAVPNATSYNWDLYVASVDKDNWIGTGTTSNLSFSGSFEDDMLITEFVPGETYLLVVTGLGEGFNGVASDAASFIAVGPSYDFTTIAELNALATSTATPLTGKLTNAVISYVTTDHKNAFIKDDTGSVLYYDKNGNLSLLQGQTFTGTLDVTLVLYNSCAQITSCDASFIGEGATVNPEIVTLSDLVGHLSEYQNAYVQVNDLTVVSKSAKNINVSNGSNTYVVFDNAGTSACVAGDIISVKGTITHYDKDNIDEIKAWVANDITITYHQIASHSVSFTQPDEGGSFTVTVGGQEIENGDELEEGTEVTLTATADEGYAFNGWTVTGATISENTETTTFTVGTSNVTITVAFRNNTGGTPRYVPVSTITEGSFLMVYKNKAASGISNNYLSVSAVTIADGVIASDSTVDTYAIEITSIGNDQYTLKIGNKYIGYSGSSTGLAFSTSASNNNYKWTISIDDGEAFIVNVGKTDRYIGANKSGDDYTQFKAYSTSNTATYPSPTLYKYVVE